MTSVAPTLDERLTIPAAFLLSLFLLLLSAPCVPRLSLLTDCLSSRSRVRARRTDSRRRERELASAFNKVKFARTRVTVSVLSRWRDACFRETISSSPLARLHSQPSVSGKGSRERLLTHGFGSPLTLQVDARRDALEAQAMHESEHRGLQADPGFEEDARV